LPHGSSQSFAIVSHHNWRKRYLGGGDSNSDNRSSPSNTEPHMRLLRIKQVIETTGLSRMTIYRMELAGRFPARRQLGANSVAWVDEEINEWLRSRPQCGPSVEPDCRRI
jgi:prophage regulatory protein